MHYNLEKIKVVCKYILSSDKFLRRLIKHCGVMSLTVKLRLNYAPVWLSVLN